MIQKSHVSHFDSTGGLTSFSEEDSEGLVKNALVLIEGTHKDNQGIVHEFPPERLLRIAQRTNDAMNRGIEIPLMADHSKALIGSDGELKKLGVFISPIECRVISQEDLPNPKMRHLVGKLGAFSKAKILRRVDDVKSKIINLLSPGVDLVQERLAEVSAVAFPAIHGPALFNAPPQIQDLTFASTKDQIGAFGKLKQSLSDAFEIYLTTIQKIDKASPDQIMGFSPEQLKLSATEELAKELNQRLGISEEDYQPQMEPTGSEEDVYNSDIYAPDVVKQPGNYSSGRSMVASFGNENRRRRRGR